MAKSVTDVAILLGALESPAPDPNDPATKTCTPPPGRDYTRFLNPDGLKSARIGIPRAFFYDRVNPPAEPVPSDTSPRESAATGGPSTRTPGAPFGTGAGFGRRGGGLNPEEACVMTEAIDILKQQGAVIVDPVEIPSVSTSDPDRSFLQWGQCSGAANVKKRYKPFGRSQVRHETRLQQVAQDTWAISPGEDAY